MNRRYLALTAILTVLLLPVGSLLASPQPLTGRSGLKSATIYPELPLSNATIAARYDLVVFQTTAVDPNYTDPSSGRDGDPQRIQKLKAINPNIKVLLYVFPQISWGGDGNPEEWFVHGDDGRRVRNPGDSNGQVLMDISNPAYRQAIIGSIMDLVNQYGFDGVFNDGVWPTVDLGQDYVGWSPRPPQVVIDNWHAWSLQLLRELKQALGGKLLITSSTTVNNTGNASERDDDFLAVVDGTVIEGYLHAPWDPQSTVNGSDWWAWQQSRLQRNVNAGKYFIGISGQDCPPCTPDQTQRLRLFTFGSYLLFADGGRAHFQWNWHGYFPELDAPLGPPLGPAYQANGVWQRDFTNGKVIVNPSGSQQTVALPEPFQTLQGTPFVSLGSSAAIIMLKDLR